MEVLDWKIVNELNTNKYYHVNVKKAFHTTKTKKMSIQYKNVK